MNYTTRVHSVIIIVHVPNSTRELKKEAQNARITLKTIESLTYECSDGVLLKELNATCDGGISKQITSSRWTGNPFNGQRACTTS